MRGSEKIDRYKIIIIRGTSAQSTFSGVTNLDAGHKVVVMRRSNPAEHKNALPVHVRQENAGKRENRQIQYYHNTRNELHKAKFSGVKKLDAIHKLL
jgi:hypothetical protein